MEAPVQAVLKHFLVSALKAIRDNSARLTLVNVRTSPARMVPSVSIEMAHLFAIVQQDTLENCVTWILMNVSQIPARMEPAVVT